MTRGRLKTRKRILIDQSEFEADAEINQQFCEESKLLASGS
jgi:hypothetical protein